MRTYWSKMVVFTFMFLSFVMISTCRQEERKLSREEFWEQVQSAIKTKDKQKLEHLVKENREHAQLVADFSYKTGIEAYRSSNYKIALAAFYWALGLYQELGDRTGEGTTFNNLGLIYGIMGYYQQSLANFQWALEISRELTDRVGEIATLTNIGGIYWSTGDYQQALNCHQEALKISKEIGDKVGEMAAIDNIGKICRATTDYQKALSYHQEALQISREIGDRSREGITQHNIGIIYQKLGNYQRALSYHQEALKISNEIGDKVGKGVILNNIGGIYWSIDNYQKALTYYHEALKISKEIGDETGGGTTLSNIGAIYQETGAYQQALNYYQQVLKISKDVRNRSGEGITLNNIGGIHQAIGDYPRALEYYQGSLNIHREIGNIAEEGTNLANIGSLYEQQKQWREAVVYYQQAITLLETIRSKAGGSEAKESFLGKEINIYLRTVNLLLHLNAPDKAFEYAERSKARSFLEQLCEATAGVKNDVDQQLLAEETSLYGKLAVIEQNLKEQISDEQREQLLEKRHSLENDLSVLQMKLRDSNPHYAELKYPQPVTVEQVQQEILKEGEVIVEYLQGEEELYVFIIGKTKFSTHTLKIDRQNLVKNIEGVMDNKVAYDLYQMAFQPIEPKIAEASSERDIQNLIIVPDGALFYLPFEMVIMKDDETPEYLVDRYTISYSPSASVLKPEILHARQPEHYAQDLLALAPFGEEETETTKVALRSTEKLLLSDALRSGLEGVQSLPYSAGEVQTIGSLYPQSVCKIGSDATKAYLKDHAKGKRYLHLSTHGYLDNQHAMYSGLLFSDGMLQTYEIFNLDIDAELTVLSACETGLGELKAGEGLVGLTRAFMYAGSPSVLVSLWPVSDPSTAAFMKRFYRNLNRGMTKARALQETKIWMKKKSYHTDEHGNVIKHNDPFYWAPFILVGAHE